MARYSRNFILDRAQKTTAVAEAISAAWQWEVKNLAELNKARTDEEARLDVVTGLEMAEEDAKGTLDTQLNDAYAYAVKGMGLARVKFAADAAKMRIVNRLEALGNSRPAKRETCKKWAMAWSQLDAVWVLNLAGETFTLGQFQAKRVVIEGNDTATPPVPGSYDSMEVAGQNARAKAEELNVGLDALETLMEQWYAAATTVFPAGTAQGDQIRGQIPTTYNPNAEPLPIPPTPSGLAGQYASEFQTLDGICLPATFAAEYVWTLTLPGNTPDVMQITTPEPNVQFTGVPPGLAASLTVAASNNTGISAAAAPVDFNT